MPSRSTSARPSRLFQASSSMTSGRSWTTRVKTAWACSRMWQLGTLIRVARSGCPARSGLIEGGQDIVHRDMHRIRSELFPAEMAGRIHDEDRMVVDLAHIHTTWKAKDAERRPEGMIAIFDNREAQVQLARHRLRLVNGIDGDPDHLGPGGLDLGQLVLQLHELPLASPSTRPFVEIHHDL